jgi:hypothetical protein
MRLLMAGHEHFELELHIDPRTGRLSRVTSTRDDLAMTLWVPFDGAQLPTEEQMPTSPGMPVTIRREITMKPLDR